MRLWTQIRHSVNIFGSFSLRSSSDLSVYKYKTSTNVLFLGLWRELSGTSRFWDGGSLDLTCSSIFHRCFLELTSYISNMGLHIEGFFSFLSYPSVFLVMCWTTTAHIKHWQVSLPQGEGQEWGNSVGVIASMKTRPNEVSQLNISLKLTGSFIFTGLWNYRQGHN